MRKFFLIPLVMVLLVVLSGCDTFEYWAVHVVINTDGSVSCKSSAYNIGSDDPKLLGSDFESFQKNYIDKNSFTDKSTAKYIMLKLWVEKGSTNGSVTFEYPDLESLLNDYDGGCTKIKRDEAGNLYLPVENKYSNILNTNGKIEKISDELSSIVWDPSKKEIHYTLKTKTGKKIISYTKLFYLKYGPSKTIRYND